MQDFEKLGVFYLGRHYDIDSIKPTQELLLYDSKDLTTHAVVVGMTGSGKTGLCINLLEEAGIDRIPAIVVDPKGDIANLLLTFPTLEPEDFRPWIDESQAGRKGMSLDQFAAAEAAKWKNGLESWGQDGERIRKLRETVEMSLYTPGSNAGRPLTILKSFAAPCMDVINDSDALRERIQFAVSGLLGLLGIDADPIRSREHILISTILNQAWGQGRNLDLGSLIGEIQNPPFVRVGIMDTDTFFPAKDRTSLAMTLNNLLASPSFSNWMEGEALDVKRLLHTPEGKPRISIISIAHLGDNERMFFVTMLLNEVLNWMRGQPGTSSLRALLYMDEVFGYFPPTRNPPSKLPMLTLLKQARAFGLGIVLATQNPVDLDYKGLSNTGTWFLGRLQTERDKARVIEGLEGAAAAVGSNFDRSRIERILSGLKARVFLMNNVHDDQLSLFETRWAMSYLRGPLTRQQLRKLCAVDVVQTEPVAGAQRDSTPRISETSVEEAALLPNDVQAPQFPDIDPRLMVPDTVKQNFVELSSNLSAGETLVYRPGLYATVRSYYSHRTYRVDCWQEHHLLVEFHNKLPSAHIWEDAERLNQPLNFHTEPHQAGRFEQLPIQLQKEQKFEIWRKELQDHIYREHPLNIYRCKEFASISEPGETLGDFKVRLETIASEKRDLETEKLRKKYAAKFTQLREAIRRAEDRIESHDAKYKQRRLDSVLSVGTSIMGALLGRKKVSVTNTRRASSSVKSINRAANQRSNVAKARDDLEGLQKQFKVLDVDFNRDVEELTDKLNVEKLELNELSVRPKKTEITIREFALVWTPWRLTSTEAPVRAFKTS